MNKYLYAYNLLTVKRLLIQTIMIFSFQYLIIIKLPWPYPNLPMYPPIGIAFIMFYLFGNNAWVGLILSGVCGYLLKGMPWISTLLYLTADIGCGYLGAFLCQHIFSTDVRVFLNLSEGLKFIKTNALITCLISSAIRTAADPKNIIYTYINLWLADLNAILILSGLLLSWVYVPFSREKILERHLIATILLFIIASIYLAYCIGIQNQHFAPVGLSALTIFTFYICHAALRAKK